MFKEGWERTVCTGLGHPFGDPTGGALLTKAACLAQSVDESCQQGPPGQGSDKPKKKTCYRRAGGESSVWSGERCAERCGSTGSLEGRLAVRDICSHTLSLSLESHGDLEPKRSDAMLII